MYQEILSTPTSNKILGLPFNYLKDVEDNRSFDYSYTTNELLKIHNGHLSLIDFKLTNSNIRIYDDYWIEENSNNPTDPRIRILDLSANKHLEVVTICESRPELKSLKINNCSTLSYVNISGCYNLEHLEIKNNINLHKIVFGNIKALKSCNLEGNNLNDSILTDVLKSLYMTTEPGVLNLRGNYINWQNRKIASKIRMYLSNNIKVLWDNPPPESIIPISYYSQFTI